MGHRHVPLPHQALEAAHGAIHRTRCQAVQLSRRLVGGDDLVDEALELGVRRRCRFVSASTFSRASRSASAFGIRIPAHDPGRLDLAGLDLIPDGAGRAAEHPGQLLRSSGGRARHVLRSSAPLPPTSQRLCLDAL